MLDWDSGRAGSFFSSLFECMSHADASNLARLGEGFPEEVEVFKKYRYQTGYFNELSAKYKSLISGGGNG